MVNNVPQTFEVSKELAARVGMITIMWAHAENALGLIVDRLFEATGPIKDHPENPVSLKRRLRYLRAAITMTTKIGVLEDRTRRVTERFATLSQERHDIIHGCAFWADSDQISLFRRDTGKDAKNAKIRTITTTDLEDLSERISVLDDQTTALVSEFYTLLI